MSQYCDLYCSLSVHQVTIKRHELHIHTPAGTWHDAAIKLTHTTRGAMHHARGPRMRRGKWGDSLHEGHAYLGQPYALHQARLEVILPRVRSGKEVTLYEGHAEGGAHLRR